MLSYLSTSYLTIVLHRNPMLSYLSTICFIPSVVAGPNPV